MANTNGDIHMVQLRLDARRLVQLGKMLHLPLARTSTNYLVHCALGELFQDQAPKPFSVENAPVRLNGEQGRYVRVLGYTAVDDDTLHEVAKAFASPTVYKINDWDCLASKPMPGVFPEGLRLRFELRACPVVRKASSGEAETPNGRRTWSKGEELDAFLSEAWEHPEEDLDREPVYVDWLERQLDTRGGAELLNAGMERFSIERMTRRTHGNGRTVKTLKRPDVTLTGILEVTDSPAFADLLQQGIGRHKSFGYGMLKVRRA